MGSSTDLWALDAGGRICRSRDGGSTWWQDPSFPGVAQQVSACADGSVWLVDQHGTAWLAAGWQRVMRPTGMPGFAPEARVSHVAAGQDEHGTRYLFFVLAIASLSPRPIGSSQA